MSERAGTRAVVTAPAVTPITISGFTLTENGLTPQGRPTFAAYQAAGEYIRRVHKASGWWLADWIAYGDGRPEWKAQVDAEMGVDQLTAQTVREYRYVAKAIPASSRLDGVSFSHHQVVASFPEEEREELLAQSRDQGWTLQEMRREARAAKRRGTITGQAELAGQYRVIYAHPPWIYGDSQPSGGSAQTHYPGMTIDQLCKVPVAAHTSKNAVLFLWVTSPLLSACWSVFDAWGFEYLVTSGGNHSLFDARVQDVDRLGQGPAQCRALRERAPRAPADLHRPSVVEPIRSKDTPL